MKMSIAVTGALCAAAVTTAVFAAKPTTRNRAEIPAEFRWDFTAIYPNWDAWEAGMKELDGRIDAFAALKGTLAQGPAQLLKVYQAYDEIGKLQYRLYWYTALQRDTDTREQAVGGRFQRARTPRQIRDRLGLVHPRAVEDPRGDARSHGSPRRPRSRRTVSRSSTRTASKRTCSTTRASGCCRSRASSTALR
jgi:hypothetical protein